MYKPVSQDAREAAAALAAGDGSHGSYMLSNMIRDGSNDHLRAVQAFAQFESLIRSRVLEEAAGVADAYSVEMDKPYAELAEMTLVQQVRYEGHKYAGKNIASSIRKLSDPIVDEGKQ